MARANRSDSKRGRKVLELEHQLYPACEMPFQNSNSFTNFMKRTAVVPFSSTLLRDYSTQAIRDH